MEADLRELLRELLQFINLCPKNSWSRDDHDIFNNLIDRANGLGISYNEYDMADDDDDLSEYDNDEIDDDDEDDGGDEGDGNGAEEHTYDEVRPVQNVYDEFDEDDDEEENPYLIGDDENGEWSTWAAINKKNRISANSDENTSKFYFDNVVSVCQYMGRLEMKSSGILDSMRKPKKRRAVLFDCQLIIYPMKDPNPEFDIDVRDAAIKKKKKDRFTVTSASHKNQTHEFKADDCDDWISSLEDASRGITAIGPHEENIYDLVETDEEDGIEDDISENNEDTHVLKYPNKPQKGSEYISPPKKPPTTKPVPKPPKANKTPHYDVPQNNKPVVAPKKTTKPIIDDDHVNIAPPVPFRNHGQTAPPPPPKTKSKPKAITPPRISMDSAAFSEAGSESQDDEDDGAEEEEDEYQVGEHEGVAPAAAPPPPPPTLPESGIPPTVAKKPPREPTSRKMSTASNESSSSSNYARPDFTAELSNKMKLLQSRRISEKLLESNTISRSKSPEKKEETQLEKIMRQRKQRSESIVVEIEEKPKVHSPPAPPAPALPSTLKVPSSPSKFPASPTPSRKTSSASPTPDMSDLLKGMMKQVEAIEEPKEVKPTKPTKPKPASKPSLPVKGQPPPVKPKPAGYSATATGESPPWGPKKLRSVAPPTLKAANVKKFQEKMDSMPEWTKSKRFQQLQMHPSDTESSADDWSDDD